MPWGRLDDKANGNPKLLALSDAAWRMWGCAIIYCQAQLTDGFVPEHAIHTFGVRAKSKRAVIEELCRSLVPGKAPLWEKVDGGYQFHDYLEWNDSRETVMVKREWDRRRKELFSNPALLAEIRTRDRNACRYCGKAVNWKDRRGPDGGAYDHVVPRGPNTAANVVVACRRCNSTKGDRPLEACGLRLRPVPDLNPDLGLDLDPTRPESAHHTTATPLQEKQKSTGAARRPVENREPTEGTFAFYCVIADEARRQSIEVDQSDSVSNITEIFKTLCALRQVAYSGDVAARAIAAVMTKAGAA